MGLAGCQLEGLIYWTGWTPAGLQAPRGWHLLVTSQRLSISTCARHCSDSKRTHVWHKSKFHCKVTLQFHCRTALNWDGLHTSHLPPPHCWLRLLRETQRFKLVSISPIQSSYGANVPFFQFVYLFWALLCHLPIAIPPYPRCYSDLLALELLPKSHSVLSIKIHKNYISHIKSQPEQKPFLWAPPKAQQRCQAHILWPPPSYGTRSPLSFVLDKF